MTIAEEKYDKERGLYYDHTTVYKKKEELDDITRMKRYIEELKEKVEKLEEKVKLNNNRINDLVNRYHEVFNDLSKFKRHILEKEKLEK